ncbi:uncharacterized protein [Elaeis guineensis]|uniref:uncharacterized protein isoform X2 n=1 Tax=Elaeis guineensis var. tenera TaxID=51953 RepID=UPI003C6D853E
MALASASPLATAAPRTLSPSRVRRHAWPPSTLIVCSSSEPKKWRAVVPTALAAAIVSFGGIGPMTAMADLNKYEANVRGEFGIGSAAQFGSADLKKAVHVNENFRRANFTAADMRESDFSGSTFNGAYLEKAVAYKANFSGADLSDTLMDRMENPAANQGSLIKCYFLIRFSMKLISQMLFSLDQFSHEVILVVQSLKVLTSVMLFWTYLKNRHCASTQVVPIR